MSLPSWERGLKCIYVAIVIHSGIVAPLVGAWIEMLGRCHRLYFFVSLPSWERGLKYLMLDCGLRRQESLPSWERGLKSYPIGAPLGASVSLPSWERGLKYLI